MRTRPWAVRLGLVILLTAGCAPSTHRVGMRMVDQGAFTQAVDHWLEALETQDQFNTRWRSDIDAYGPDAYRELLDRAQAHEQEGDLRASLDTYLQIESLVTRLEELGLLSFPLQDHASERTDVQLALARELSAQAQQALTAENWQAALDRLDDVAKLRSLEPGEVASQAQGHRGLGFAALQAGRYRDALTSLTTSYERAQNPEVAAWIASIHTALGRDLLQRGACRQAVTELTAASRIPIDQRVSVDLDAAQACARVEVVLQPIEEFYGDVVAGTAFGAMLVDTLQAELVDRGSDYLHILDADYVARPDAPGPGTATRFEVNGRITQLQAEETDRESFKATTPGVRKRLCGFDDPGYDPTVISWCEDTAVITYAGWRQTRTMRMAGSIRVIETKSGNTHINHAMQHTTSAEAAQVETFEREVEGALTPAKVGAESTQSLYGIDPTIIALKEPPPALPNHGELAARAVRQAAEQAAQAILARIDNPAQVEDFANLTVRDPSFSANDLNFQPSVHQSEVLPEPEPEPEPEAPTP